MKPSELVRRCAEAIEFAEKHALGLEPAFSLVWPKGSKGLFPIHGRLQCVNTDEDRVYAVTVADVLSYVSRMLKANRTAVQQDGGRGT
jgi:hypothetical protein